MGYPNDANGSAKMGYPKSVFRGARMGYPNNRSAAQGWDIPKQLNEIGKLGYPMNGEWLENDGISQYVR